MELSWIISAGVGLVISVMSWLIKDKIKAIAEKIDSLCTDLKDESSRARAMESKIFDRIDTLPERFTTKEVFENEKDNNWRSHTEIKNEIDGIKRKVYNGNGK